MYVCSLHGVWNVTSKAMKTYMERCNFFGKVVENELSVKVSSTMKTARLTIVEANLLKAMLMSAKDLDESQSMVNAQLLALRKTDINTSDIHPCLWKASQDILKGKKVTVDV